MLSLMLRLHYVPAATAITFQATVDKTGRPWDNVGGRDGQTWDAVIAVDAGPDF